jgi:hypothetical protein
MFIKNPRSMLLINGALLLIIGIYMFLYGSGTMEQNFLPGMAGLSIGLLFSLWGMLSLMHRRRFKAKLAHEVVQEDQRAPVIYLRSFKDDQAASMVTIMGGGVRFISYVTEEEQLAEAMNKIGPFLAIGQPGEPILDLRDIRRNPNRTEAQKKRAEAVAWLKLVLSIGPAALWVPRDEIVPDLGAARMYVSDDAWQDRVKELLSQAQLVVLRAGETDNLLWEVQTVAGTVRPERIVFLLPFPNQKKYDIFREKTAHLFPKPFPEKYKKNLWMQTGSIKALLYFEPDWTPHTIALKNPFYLFQSFFRPLVPILQYALKPIYQRLGLRYSKPRLNPWIIGIPLVGMVLVLLLSLS